MDKYGTKVALALGVIVAGLFLRRCVSFYRQVKATNGHPGFVAALSPSTLLGNIVPPNDLLNPASGRAWRKKRYWEDKFRSSILVSVGFNSPRTVYAVTNPEAVRILANDRRKFAKPVESYRILAVFGENVLTTEAEEWRRHRKIVAPGFSEKVFDLVWRTSTNVMHEMMQNEGLEALKPGEYIDLKDVTSLTIRLALAVLSTASFGNPMQWSTEANKKVPSGHIMTMADAITTVSENIIWLLLAPKAVLNLPIRYLRHVKDSSDELVSYMTSMIRTRRAELQTGSVQQKHDLFNQLIENSGADAQAGEKGDGGLTDEELVGNIFIFALAGHETSAHTLVFVFAMLALYPEKQKWLREEIMEVMPAGHTPTYKDYPKLTRALAVLYETLRLFPAVVVIPKVSLEDTYLPNDNYPLAPYSTDNSAGSSTPADRPMVFIPKGTPVDIYTPALHRHPSHWEDPDAFKPERFLGDYNKDAFIPFSAGARACIGRRFAEVEAVCMLAILVRNYDIETISVPGETREQLEGRLLDAIPKLTLTPKHAVPLRLRKRDVGPLDWPSTHVDDA